RHTTAYYGQLARAKLGLDKMELRTPPAADSANTQALADELVRAADMLYTVGERDLAASFVSDLAEQSGDAATLAALGELTGRRNHAHAMLEIGRIALARGLAVDPYAFPTIGIPQHNPIGPAIDRSIIYSVARTESAFDQRDKSSAMAVGLMQVTPEAGRDTAKRFGVEYDWVKAYGDPRDPNVDPVDWVERIPFSETRNYVQRVMENMLVYRVRFGAPATVVSKIDQRDGAGQEAGSAPPFSTQASGSE